MRGTQSIKDRLRRGAMTLIELLVVIVLLTTLVTTAIPILSPGGEERKLREASRGINAYLQGAQARAIQTGRPYGVAFRRLSADSERPEDNAVCAQLRYVEVPPPYSGVDSGSVARLCVCEADGVRHLGLQLLHYEDDNTSNAAQLPPGYEYGLLPDGFLQPGDRVEIGGNRTFTVELLPYIERHGQRTTVFDTIRTHEGNSPFVGYYDTSAEVGPNARTSIFRVRLVNDNAIPPQRPQPLRLTHNWNGVEIATPESIPNGELPDWGTDQNPRFTSNFLATTPAPYKIYRQPTLAGGEPYELATGTAVDLQGSVFGNGVRVYRPESDFDGSAFRLRTADFMVLFSPGGNIHRVYNVPDLDGPQPVSGSLALLIGRRELIPAAPNNAGGTPTAQDYAEPIDLGSAAISNLSETEATEITDQYNWLNLQSQWIVIGGQSGSVTSIDNSAVYPAEADTNDDGVVTLSEQLSAALENAPRRTASGGR